MASCKSARAGTCLSEGALQILHGKTNQGNKAERYCYHQAKAQRESDCSRIHSNLTHTWKTLLIQTEQQFHSPKGNDDTECASRENQQQILSDELSRQTETCCAECGAQRKVALASCYLGQHEICDVYTRHN